MTIADTHRAQLLRLFRIALQAVSGERAVAQYLQEHFCRPACSVVAIGKAAASMARGAEQVLGDRIRSGLVITKPGHGNAALNSAIFLQLEGGHPLPDEHSLVAGEALLRFLADLPEGEPLLFLLSGGASALVEVLPEGMSLPQLRELNRWLLASGLAIGEMNTIRRRLSRIKGGKLIPHLRGRPCLQLLISDVPGDVPEVIGSGPLFPQPDSGPVSTALPQWLAELLAAPHEKTVEVSNIESHIIASNDTAREALVAAAKKAGLPVIDHPTHFQGDTAELAAEFCSELLQGSEGLYVWGGESSVTLPGHPGRGGRNQQLALLASRYLAGHERLLLLAVGTDGSDGPTEDAGALVDGGTVQRGEWEGLSAIDATERCDAGTFLEASGDLIQTGPTGTNVMDLIVAWKW